MRYGTFSPVSDSSARLGVVAGDRVTDFAAAARGKWPGEPPATLLALVDLGPDAWRRAHDLMATAATANSYALADVRWHAPVPRLRKNVFCLGLNYKAHAQESAQARGREIKIPTVPVFFTKAPTTVNGPYGDVPIDTAVTSKVDWEVELGVVIGRSARSIPKADAPAHVFGYTVINDISARDLQSDHMQWFKGKSLDGFCPMGPVVVTADEFGDPQAKRLQCRVNGATKQDATTADMIFPVDVIIEWLSRGLTLEAGDIIATGTPEGVGMGRSPQEFLKPGDIVETEIEGIGTLRNRVVSR
jgi:2-keto-4-pentenoate hydratase/2-oxohepta-3-ene-1,7-dioic acid hydratase in catechol pathway